MSKITIRDTNEFPRVTERIKLEEYHKDLKGDFIDVWVNISRDLHDRLREGRIEALNIAQLPFKTEEDFEERDQRTTALILRMHELHSEWWGLPLAEIKYLYSADVNLYEWIVSRANDLKDEYEKKRKNAGRESSDS